MCAGFTSFFPARLLKADVLSSRGVEKKRWNLPWNFRSHFRNTLLISSSIWFSLAVFSNNNGWIFFIVNSRQNPIRKTNQIQFIYHAVLSLQKFEIKEANCPIFILLTHSNWSYFTFFQRFRFIIWSPAALAVCWRRSARIHQLYLVDRSKTIPNYFKNQYLMIILIYELIIFWWYNLNLCPYMELFR